MVNTGKGEAHGDAGGRRFSGAIRKKTIAREKEKCIKKTHGAVPEGRDGGEKGRPLRERTEER